MLTPAAIALASVQAFSTGTVAYGIAKDQWDLYQANKVIKKAEEERRQRESMEQH